VSCREAKDLIVYMMYMYNDTHDRDEGINGIEKGLVAICLFLQMLNSHRAPVVLK